MINFIAQDEQVLNKVKRASCYEQRLAALDEILSQNRQLPQVTGLVACLTYGVPVMPLRSKVPYLRWSALAASPSYAKSRNLMFQKDPAAVKAASSKEEIANLNPALASAYGMLMGALINDYEMLSKEPNYSACFDFDNGEQAERFVSTLKKERPILLETFMQQTNLKENGKRGLHYIFCSKRLFTTKALPKFDLKAYKGYVQGPGSIGKDPLAYKRLNKKSFRLMNTEELEYLRQTVASIIGKELLFEEAQPKHISQSAYRLVNKAWIKNGKEGSKKPKGRIFKASKSDFDMSLCQSLYLTGHTTTEQLAQAYKDLKVKPEFSQAVSFPERKVEIFERILQKCASGRSNEVLEAVTNKLLDLSEARNDYTKPRTDRLLYQTLIKTLAKTGINRILVTGNREAKQIGSSTTGARSSLQRLIKAGFIEYCSSDDVKSKFIRISISQSLTDEVLAELKIEDSKTKRWVEKFLKPKHVVTTCMNTVKTKNVCISISSDNPSLTVGISGKSINSVLTFVVNNDFEKVSTKELAERLGFSSRATARKYLRIFEQAGIVSSEATKIRGNVSELWTKVDVSDCRIKHLEFLLGREGRNERNVRQETMNFAAGSICFLADCLSETKAALEFFGEFFSPLFELLQKVSRRFIARKYVESESGETVKQTYGRRSRDKTKRFGVRRSLLDFAVGVA